MDGSRLDAIARTLAGPGSRRRLLSGGLSGAVAALGARLGLARAQDCDCGPGFECSTGVCRPISCPPFFEPCLDAPDSCCPTPDRAKTASRKISASQASDALGQSGKTAPRAWSEKGTATLPAT